MKRVLEYKHAHKTHLECQFAEEAAEELASEDFQQVVLRTGCF